MSRRARAGPRAFIGLLFLLAVAIICGIFMPVIFGAQDEAADVNGTVYAPAYNGTSGIAMLVTSSWPILMFAIGIAAVIVMALYARQRAGRR